MKTTEKKKLLDELKDIHAAMLAAEKDKKELLDGVTARYKNSAVNLIDYLTLRSKNIENLQKKLHDVGLSSLERSESHIKWQVLSLMKWLGRQRVKPAKINPYKGYKELQKNIVSLLGEAKQEDVPRVMVTFDTEFATNFELLCDLLENGMNVARINCAHDDDKTWLQMIENLRKATDKTKLPCKIYMDLAGPKIRTKIISHKKEKSKLKVALGEEIILAEPDQKAAKHQKIICCTLPGIVENLNSGQRVYFDDGLFEAIVQSTSEKKAILKITRISSKKSVIKSEKGINFPDTVFSVNPITEYDQKCLPFILEYADMAGFSFVNNAADIEELQAQLSDMDKPDFPIVAKIETNQAVQNLPEIILKCMKQRASGVMIARGDLAIEIGFERMSEIQEEILWICEAAHLPVIWATQVLENMNKNGMATRGEITDAAHAAAADCVMLNKGGHTVEVLKTLINVLLRSRKNTYKNRRLFRKLSIAENFLVADQQ